MNKIRHRSGVIVEKDDESNSIIEIDAGRLGRINIDLNSHFTFDKERIPFAVREGGIFAGKALYLTDRFDWVLCSDDKGVICLAPLRKGREVAKDE